MKIHRAEHLWTVEVFLIHIAVANNLLFVLSTKTAEFASQREHYK